MTPQPIQKFDPATVATLRKLLDLAVDQIAEQHRTPATKAKMAATIVRHASDGISDHTDLLSHAVAAGADGAP